MLAYDDYISYKEEQLMKIVNQLSNGAITYEDYISKFNSLMNYEEFLRFATNQQ